MKKASITVEASLVCPLFICAVMALINIVAWFGKAEDVQRELTDKALMLDRAAFAAEGMLSVDYDDADIRLPYAYTADMKAPLPELIKPHVCQHVVCRQFIGVMEIEGVNDGEIVYVTPAGAVYHSTDECSYIKSSLYEVEYGRVESIRNESGGKYYPCELCSVDGNSDYVYVTLYGNRYHGSRRCSAVRKNAVAVFRDDVPWLRACSKCGRSEYADI